MTKGTRVLVAVISSSASSAARGVIVRASVRVCTRSAIIVVAAPAARNGRVDPSFACDDMEVITCSALACRRGMPRVAANNITAHSAAAVACVAPSKAGLLNDISAESVDWLCAAKRGGSGLRARKRNDAVLRRSAAMVTRWRSAPKAAHVCLLAVAACCLLAVSQAARGTGARAYGVHRDIGLPGSESKQAAPAVERAEPNGPRALFGWGRNNAGQLGLGHANDVSSPEVSCASTHGHARIWTMHSHLQRHRHRELPRLGCRLTFPPPLPLPSPSMYLYRSRFKACISLP